MTAIRPGSLVGLALIAIGVYLIYPGLTVTSERSVLNVGEFRASVEERRPVPPWVGAVAVAAGILLVASELKRRRGGPH